MQVSVAGTFEVPPRHSFFNDPPFPKCGTESCLLQQNGEWGTGTGQGFSQRFRRRESTPGRGSKATLKEWGIFGKKRDTGGIILGDNLGAHCFVLRGLVPTRFSSNS